MERGLRKISIEKNCLRNPLGSCLITFGNTKVLCSCSLSERVPRFILNSGKGWISAEYSLLPNSTETRTMREAVKGRQQGRTIEIQRLISRSLRSVVDLKKLGEKNLIVDCDVIEADGGTRCASITGGFIALELAVNKLLARGELKENPIIERVAAISVGVVDEQIVLDLDYLLDSNADVDMNIIMTESKKYVEVQGTGEEYRFSREQLEEMLDLAWKGIQQIFNETK